jgi:hypothetical protein
MNMALGFRKGIDKRNILEKSSIKPGSTIEDYPIA